MSTALGDVIAKSRALLAAVDFDNNGNVVGMARMGGNGGLLSIDTTKAADALRLAFDRLQATPALEWDWAELDMIKRGDMLGPRLGQKVFAALGSPEVPA